jgi:cob(I)alamin adenosyltransferase
MARFTRITTGAGDDGTTSLPGAPKIPKDDVLVALLGDLDELSAALGLARSTAGAGGLPGGAQAAGLLRRIRAVQGRVGEIAASVAQSPRGAGGADRPEVSAWLSAIEEEQEGLRAGIRLPEHFVLPGETRLGAELHLARTVCRRAERRCVAAARAHTDAGLEHIVPVLNRLSDYLFVLAAAAEPDPGTTRSV